MACIVMLSVELVVVIMCMKETPIYYNTYHFVPERLTENLRKIASGGWMRSVENQDVGVIWICPSPEMDCDRLKHSIAYHFTCNAASNDSYEDNTMYQDSYNYNIVNQDLPSYDARKVPKII